MKTARAQTRCRECGTIHSPKCRPLPRSAEVAIWRAILNTPEALARREARREARRKAKQ